MISDASSVISKYLENISKMISDALRSWVGCVGAPL
jgi:hypothetical protein